jgi:hypothetical protein
MNSNKTLQIRLIVSEEILKKYVETYKHYLEELKDELPPRELRLFDIRIRIAIDMVVGFYGVVSYTKSSLVAEAYASQIRLMELWNAYEAFIKYLDYLELSRGKEAKYKLIKSDLMQNSGARETIDEFFKEIKVHYEYDEAFRQDYHQYISRMKRACINQKLAETCASTIEYLSGKKGLSGYELFALVYAERNMYLHDGESAKLGWNYKRRNLILALYSEHFVKSLLQVAAYVLDEQIKQR